MAQTEAPIFLVVRSPIRNPIRVFGYREYMLFELLQGDSFVNRYTVIENMEIARVKIYDLFAFGILYISVPYVPFFWYCPIEDRRVARNFMNR